MCRNRRSQLVWHWLQRVPPGYSVFDRTPTAKFCLPSNVNGWRGTLTFHSNIALVRFPAKTGSVSWTDRLTHVCHRIERACPWTDFSLYESNVLSNPRIIWMHFQRYGLALSADSYKSLSSWSMKRRFLSRGRLALRETGRNYVQRPGLMGVCGWMHNNDDGPCPMWRSSAAWGDLWGLPN